MKGKKIILWGGWYGSRNVGDRALLLSITDLLAESCPGVSFVIPTARPDLLLEYTSRLSKQEILPIQGRRQFLDLVRAFKECDLFIFGGAVPFFDEPSQVLTVLVLTALARWFHVPMFLWSVSSQLVTSRLAKMAFRWTLGAASGVTCRDEFTRELFEECGLPAERTAVTGDAAFLMRSDPPGEALALLDRAGWQPGGRPLAALVPRVLRSADGESETHYRPRTAAQFQHEIETYAAALDWLWERGFQPVFVPMNTAAPDDDRAAARLVMDRARFGRSALLIDGDVQPRAVPALFQLCRLSLVSRLHGSIMSIRGGCPVLMYAFDRKHIGLMQAVGLGGNIFEPGSRAPGEVTACLEHILEAEPSARQRIAQAAGSAAESARIPLRLVLEILAGGKAGQFPHFS